MSEKDPRMGIRGPKDEGERLTVSFRCPPGLVNYVEKLSEEEGRDKTEVFCAALELDRDLQDKLRESFGRIGAFAAKHKLKLDRDLPEIYARLVRLGLDKDEP